MIKKTFSLGSHVINLGLVTELLNNNLRRGTNSTRFVHLILAFCPSFHENVNNSMNYIECYS